MHQKVQNYRYILIYFSFLNFETTLAQSDNDNNKGH